MRNRIFTTLLVATIIPAAAMPSIAAAQSAAEVRSSQRHLQEERRDLRQAERRGDPRQVREERRDVRHARQNYRDDVRDYRRSHPKVYARGTWRAPFRYHPWKPGVSIGRSYFAPRYYIANPAYYRLPAPGRNMRWIRHYDDVVLVNIRTGMVVDVYRGFFF